MTVAAAGTQAGDEDGDDRDAVWRRRFERRRGRHAGVTAVGVGDLRLAPPARRALERSLATFQLGESGSGDHLFAAAAGAGVSDDHRAALHAFVAEEQEHARLLAVVLDALGVEPRRSHWTDAVFVHIRRSRTLRSEVLTLLVAELIALSYYRALHDGIGEPSLRDVFGRIHADEVRHVDFHAETLPPYLRRSARPGRLAARVAWNVLVVGASLVVAADHGRALAAVGLTRRRLVVQVHRDRRRLDRRLFGGNPAGGTGPRR